MSSYPRYATTPSPNLLRFPVYGGSLGQSSDPGTPHDVINGRKNSFGSSTSIPSVHDHRTISGYTQASDLTEEDDLEGGKEEAEDPGGWRKVSRGDIFVLISLCTSQVWSSMFYSLLAPFFPTEAIQKGASNTEVGFILGIFPALVFLTAPIYGKYITVIGPKFMYVAGIFGTSTCAILFGVLQWCPEGIVYVSMCFVTRTVEALACSAVGTANLTIAAATFPNRINSVMGILQACSCVGLMTGPPLGGLLFSAGGFYLPFAICGGVYMLCGLLSWKILPSIEAEEAPIASPSRWKLLRIPIIIFVGYLMVVGQAAIGFCDVALAIHVVKFKLSPAIVGLLFLIPSGAVIILAPVFGWIVDRNMKHARPIIIVGATIGSIGFLGLGPSPLIASFIPSDALWIVAVSLLICGVGMSCLVITYSEFAIATRERNFPDTTEVKGMISGIYNSLNSLGSFLGPTVGGVMLEHLGFDWSSTIFAGGCLFAAFLLLFYTIIRKCCNGCWQGNQEQNGDVIRDPLLPEEVPQSED